MSISLLENTPLSQAVQFFRDFSPPRPTAKNGSMILFKDKLPPECFDKLNGAIRKVFMTGKDYSFELAD